MCNVQYAYCIVLFIVSSEPAKSVFTTSSIRPAININENDDRAGGRRYEKDNKSPGADRCCSSVPSDWMEGGGELVTLVT